MSQFDKNKLSVNEREKTKKTSQTISMIHRKRLAVKDSHSLSELKDTNQSKVGRSLDNDEHEFTERAVHDNILHA